MKKNTSSFFTTQTLLPFAFIVAACWFVNYRMLPIELSDPDHYYHLGIARAFSESVLPRSLPQAEDLGWKDRFPGQHFLYSALTGLGYRVGGETGVEIVCLLLSFAILGTIYLLLNRYLAPVISAGVLASAVLTNGYFTHRLFCQRPLLLALFSILIMLMGVLERRPALSLIGGIVFSWCYYTHYLPLLVLVAAYFCFRDKVSRKACLWAVGGLAGATFLHPYFPRNLIALWTSMKILLTSSGSEQSWEMMTIQSSGLFTSISFFFVLFLLGVFTLGASFQGGGKTKIKRDELVFFLVTSGLFLVLTFFSPRSIEYAVPFTVLLAGPVIVYFTAAFDKAAWAMMGLAVFLGFPQIRDVFLKPPALMNDSQRILQAVDAIPKEPGKKVFNCTWSDGAYLLYRRPDLRFIDALDPIFLQQASAEKKALREMVKQGANPFPYKIIKGPFKADYVLCSSKATINQLDQDPHFRRIYPSPSARGPFTTLDRFVYEVAERPLPYWAREFEIRVMESRSVASQKESWIPLNLKGEYLNLGFRETLPAGVLETHEKQSEVCLYLRPTAKEMADHAGAQFVAVGGGPRLTVSFNRQGLFENGETPKEPRSLSYFIRLPKPLSKTDQMVLHVCAKPTVPFVGASMSFWKESDIRSLCGRPSSAAENFPWTGAAPHNCMGAMALPTSKGWN